MKPLPSPAWAGREEGKNGKKKTRKTRKGKKKKSKKWKRKFNCCQSYASAFQAKVIGTIERGFQRYGEFVGKRYLVIIVAAVLLAVVCGAVVPVLYKEKTEDLELWLPTDSDFSVRSRFLARTFESNARHNFVLVVAEDGNVLSARNIRAISRLREDLSDIETAGGATWHDRCKLQARSVGVPGDAVFPDDVCTNATAEAEAAAEMVCTESHLLELWAENGKFDNISVDLSAMTDQDILDSINVDVPTSGLTGRKLQVSSFLGMAEHDGGGNIVSAKAMLLTFVEESHDDGTKEMKKTLQFEESFIKCVNEYKFGDSGLKAFPNAARSDEDIINEAQNDKDLLIIGYLLVLVYIMIMLGRFNLAQQRILLSLVGLLSVGLGIITSYGICSLFGIWGSSMNLVIPFMLLGIGIDDMFVIVQNFDTLEEIHGSKPLHEKMGLTMKHAGVAVTITTVTDLMAFTIGATTILPALRHFCVYAAFGILFVFLYIITFFFSCFVLDEMRSEALRDACICCWKKSDWNTQSLLSSAFGRYAKLLLTLPGQIVSLILTTVLLGISIWGVTQLEPEFDPTIFITPGTYLRDFLEYKDHYFPSDGMVGSVYIIDIEDVYKKMNIVKELRQDLGSMDMLAHGSGRGGFEDAFESFIDNKIGEDKKYPETALEKTVFHAYLAEFIFTYGRPFMPAVKFKEQLACSAEASEISIMSLPYKHKVYETSGEHIERMNDMHSFADKYQKKLNGGSSAKVFAMSNQYFEHLATDILTTELVRNILLALLCVFLATLFLIANLFASVIVVFSVILVLIDLSGFMFFWGLNLDILICILIIIALGLSIDYSAHIAHAFMVATGTRKERVYIALVDLGPAVLNGGFSTFLAFAVLMFTRSIFFLAFFKVFFLVVFFGLFHGLVFLPVVLSFIGPPSSTPGDSMKLDSVITEPATTTAPGQITRVKPARRPSTIRAKSAFSVSRLQEK